MTSVLPKRVLASKRSPHYWPLLTTTPVCYVLLMQDVKMWLVRRKWI